jgi:hypothetical protein
VWIDDVVNRALSLVPEDLVGMLCGEARDGLEAFAKALELKASHPSTPSLRHHVGNPCSINISLQTRVGGMSEG